MHRRVKVFFDGGHRPVTGMETAVVVRGKEYVRRDLGPGTSLEAEWRALIDAVRIATELCLSDPVFLGDALAVVQPASGARRCRGASERHLQLLAAYGQRPDTLRLRHIKRSQNLAGIALARLHDR